MTVKYDTTLTDNSGNPVHVSEQMAHAIEAMKRVNQNGLGIIKGYIPKTNYITRPVVNIQFMTNINYHKLVERQKRFTERVKLEDARKFMTSEKFDSVSDDDLQATFDQRKQKLIESYDKTLSGDRTDSHRQAHDRNYRYFDGGIKVNLITEKNDEGVQEPVLDSKGIPTARAIILTVIELDRETVKKGEKKKVNSGVPVLTGNAINDVLREQRTPFVTTLTLNDENFDSIVVSGQKLERHDLMDLRA